MAEIPPNLRRTLGKLPKHASDSYHIYMRTRHVSVLDEVPADIFTIVGVQPVTYPEITNVGLSFHHFRFYGAYVRQHPHLK